MSCVDMELIHTTRTTLEYGHKTRHTQGHSDAIISIMHTHPDRQGSRAYAHDYAHDYAD